MKILQVSNLFSPRHGGSAEVPYRLSCALAGRGHRVALFTSDFRMAAESLHNLESICFRAFKTWVNVAGFQKTPGIILAARREVKDTDIIHLHNYRTFQNIVLHHYARKYGVPYVLQAHGSLPKIMSKIALKQAFDICWGNTILKDAARVIAVTPLEARQYVASGVTESKIRIIPHGVALEEFADLPRRGEFKEKHGIPQDRKIVLYLGRLHRIKGLDLLVKAFRDLTGTIKDAVLVVAGPDDGYGSALRKLTADLKLEEKVLFTGALYGREKLSAYVDADVSVLPSVYEIFGITVLESLACGTPVVLTDRCGIADAVKDTAGLVVGYDEKQLRDAILRLLSDEQLRGEFGGRGRALVREKFSWANIAVQVEQLYREILS